MQFGHYYSGAFTEPAEFTEFCKSKLPKYIDTILEFGCASGKNINEFGSKYNLYGYDIVESDRINFTPSGSNFVYEKKSVEEWVDTYDKDLSTTFVMCSGTLMYVNSKYQNSLMKKLFNLNCKNMAFQEYWPFIHPDGVSMDGHGGFGPDKKYIDMFEIHNGWYNNGQRDTNLSVFIGIDGYNWNI